MDWLTLLLFVPLVVVPVVFLSGFAGCDIIFGLHEHTFPPPSDLKATAIGVDRIELSWNDVATNTTHFNIRRAENGGQFITIGEGIPATAGTPPIPNTHLDASGLKEATPYEYQVFAVHVDFESQGSNKASATTLGWKTAFEAVLNADQANWANDCMVQRINATGNLFNSGTQVRITLRGSTTIALRIKKAYISQAQSPPGGGPNTEVDSLASDLTQVKFGGNDGVLLPPNTPVRSDETVYPIDQTKDLIIAFDIGSNPEDGARHGPKVGCRAFRSATNDQAGKVDGDRSNFQLESANTVYLVEKIEVLS